MPSRLTKQLWRWARVAWREQPTSQDLEELEANVERVGLVIHLRWALVGNLTLFSAVALAIYTTATPVGELVPRMAIPAGAVVFVLAYNLYYELTYKRLGNIRLLNHAQLLFDVLVTSVLIYYSGGVYSWFYGMYLLFVLEAGLILPKRYDAWIVAGVAALSYGSILLATYLRWLPRVEMPFVTNDLHYQAAYVGVRYLWNITILAGTAILTTMMGARVGLRAQRLKEISDRDETTGLADRDALQGKLVTELARAGANGGAVSLALIDINHFERVNRSFGFLAGNRLLRAIAGRIAQVVDELGPASGALVARYGGEEFALVLPHFGGGPMLEDAAGVAEKIRAAVESFTLEEVSVTVSIGLAATPTDANSVEGLLAAADHALYAASSAGGNRVVTAADAAEA